MGKLLDLLNENPPNTYPVADIFSVLVTLFDTNYNNWEVLR